MSDPLLLLPPEELEEVLEMLENPYDENENKDSGLQGEMENLPPQEGFDTLGLDAFGPPSNSGVQENLLDNLGLQELYSSNCADKYSSPHSEDSILESKGDMKIEPIESDEVARYSEVQESMHVKRTGLFKIRLTCEGVPSFDGSTFHIRLMLVRDHESFRDLPVDKVCKKHEDQGGNELNNHVLRYSKDYNFYPANYVEGYRPSIVFEVPAPEDGKIDVPFGVYFICNDSCVTSQQMVSGSKSMAHKARPLRLVCTLEIRRNFQMEILQRSSMLLWIKAALDKTHLIREQRRGPQGGLAQKLKRESESEPGNSRVKKRKAKKRKVGDEKVKVPTSMEVSQPEPPVDHMELLLFERVYHEADQVMAADNLYLEMLTKIIARNEAVDKNLQ